MLFIEGEYIVEVSVIDEVGNIMIVIENGGNIDM